jgi:RNA polymerase sigma-70 factor, ECF subfamily
MPELNPASEKKQTADFLPLLLACQPKLRSFIFALVPHWHDADEIYQETSLVLWEKFGQYQAGTNFSAWACKIAHNKVVNYRSRRAVKSRLFSDAFVDAVADERIGRTDCLGNRRDDWDDRRQALAGCCEKLRPTDRELLDRCYQSATTVKEVAEELGRPADTIYKSLKRIREVLYRCVRRTLAQEDRT